MLRGAAVAAFALLAVVHAIAAPPLFPTPLHLTRQVVDPISGKTVTLHEYGYGNRLVSVRGAVTAIADYDRSELIEIDREKGTYSITRFDAVASAAQKAGGPPTANARSRPAVRGIAARATKSGRQADFFEGTVEAAGIKQSVEIGVDRSVRLSREALEVILGAAYPGIRRGEHDLSLSAAGPRLPVASASQSSPAAEQFYALPIEQVLRYEVDGQELEFRNSVVRVGDESPPADLVAIPAGAQLVVSRLVEVAREIERLEQPPLEPRPNP